MCSAYWGGARLLLAPARGPAAAPPGSSSETAPFSSRPWVDPNRQPPEGGRGSNRPISDPSPLPAMEGRSPLAGRAATCGGFPAATERGRRGVGFPPLERGRVDVCALLSSYWEAGDDLLRF